MEDNKKMKLSKTHILSLIACCLLLLPGCTDSDPYTQPEPEPGPQPQPGVEVEINTEITTTRQSNVTGESAYKNLWLIMYDENNDIEYCRNLLEGYNGDIDVGDVRRISRVLTKEIVPGEKKFYAIGNAPSRWEPQLVNAEKDNKLNLAALKWLEEDLPQLKKDENGKYVKEGDDGQKKFVIDTDHHPMRFSGYTEQRIKPDSANYVIVPVYRIAAKLEVEFVPGWKEKENNEYTGETIDLNPIAGYNYEPIAITVRNRAVESLLLEFDKSIDPLPAIQQAAGPPAPADPESGLILQYAAGEEPQKTIKTVPVYLLENYPGFTLNPDTVWNTYRTDCHPLIDMAITSNVGGIPSTYHHRNIPFEGVVEDGTQREIKGVYRNHYYHLRAAVWVDPASLYVALEVKGWTEVDLTAEENNGGIIEL